MKILLACSAGMSTSLLVNNMKKFADASDVIEARPVRTVPDILDDWDVLLLGPQVRYLEKEYKPLCAEGQGLWCDPYADLWSHGWQGLHGTGTQGRCQQVIFV